MTSLVYESAVRQIEFIRARDVSVLELAEAHIRQIERLNPILNAFADFDPMRVLAQARILDAVPAEARGVLHGLPVTIKSSIATAGYKCEIGSELHAGDIPLEDAVAVARMRAEGALILGTTNCPEFLMAYETTNLLHGQTRNPWDPERTPGGSSGGESAAIAAGMSACGLGSDSGGSVRVPAHFTGTCALKPTPGRFPGRGHMPPCVGPFSTLGAVGPMARSIGDVTLLFRTIGGPDDADPSSPPMGICEPVPGQLRNRRIGVFEDDDIVPVTPETRSAVRAASQALSEAGFRVEAFRPSTLERLRKLWRTFFVQCGAMFYESEIRGRHERLSPTFREFLEIAARTGPLDSAGLLNAWAEMDLLRSKTLQEMRDFSVLLCPVASVPAWKHGERQWTVEGRVIEYLDAVRYTQWFNVLGAPSAVVPVGRSSEGLPIGVQLTARPFEDETALGIAEVVDNAFGFRRPPLADLP